MPRLHSLQTGRPQEHGTAGADDPMKRPWRSGIFKTPVDGPRRLVEDGLTGDEQADTKHHGGRAKAVCVYPLSRYPHWRARLGKELAPGSFGENFTVSGTDEEDVCIGDVYTIGAGATGVRVQVSQPRAPCWKLARRHGEKKLAHWFQQTGFTGWYLRVLTPGRVEAGQPLHLERRPHPEWTVLRANRVRHQNQGDRDAAARLAACPALSDAWKRKLRRHIARKDTPGRPSPASGHDAA